MKIVAYILAGIIFVFWLFFLNISRKKTAISLRLGLDNPLMKNTIFQLNVLPLYTSIFLIIRGQPLLIIVAVVIYFLVSIFPNICYVLSLALNFTLVKLIFLYIWGSFTLDWLVILALTFLLDYLIVGHILIYVHGYGLEGYKIVYYEEDEKHQNDNT